MERCFIMFDTHNFRILVLAVLGMALFLFFFSIWIQVVYLRKLRKQVVQNIMI